MLPLCPSSEFGFTCCPTLGVTNYSQLGNRLPSAGSAALSAPPHMPTWLPAALCCSELRPPNTDLHILTTPHVQAWTPPRPP